MLTARNALRSLLRHALALSALVGLSTAQGNVMYVGPTRTLTQITSALNSYSPGALILVDPGTYDAFTVWGVFGEVAIVAAGGSFTVASSPGIPEISVQGVQMGDSVTIVGAQIAYDDPLAPAVDVWNNDGAVRFRRLIVDQAADLGVTAASVRECVKVSGTPTFWLLDSSIWPVPDPNVCPPSCSPAPCTPVAPPCPKNARNPNPIVLNNLPNDGISGLTIEESGAVVQNCRIRAYDNTINDVGFGGDALRVSGDESSVWLLQDKAPHFLTNLIGGSGGDYGGHAVHQISSAFVESRVRSCGGPDHAVSLAYGPGAGDIKIGGVYGWNNTNGATGSGSGGGAAFQIVEHCQDAQRNETAVLSDTVSIGTNLSVRLRTKLAREYFVVLSFDTEYIYPLPGFSGRGVAGASFQTLSGQTSAQTFHTLSIPVPNLTSLIGRQIAVQGAFGPIGGSYTNAGLPGMVVIGP